MPTGEHFYLDAWRLQEVQAIAEEHLHLNAGLPFLPEPGECEVCDVLWLLRQEEGERRQNLAHLMDAVTALEARNAHHG